MDGRSCPGILTLGLGCEQAGTREITQGLRVTWARCLAGNLLLQSTQRRQQGQACELEEL